MIEMLTVIAIIALLAAITFPVFATVRESARRGQCVSNMKDIYQGVRAYRLDNPGYPDYLLGPAVTSEGEIATSTADAISLEQVTGMLNTTAPTSTPPSPVDKVKTLYNRSLFPAYVKSVDRFHCPNNTEANTRQQNKAVQVSRLTYNRTVTPPAQPAEPEAITFYQYDSYDANRAIEPATKRLGPQFVARYSRLWTPVDSASTSDPNYSKQLTWRTPPDDTYITMCTYHVSKDKIIVLWLNGQAKVLDPKKLDSLGPSTAVGYSSDYDMYKSNPGL